VLNPDYNPAGRHLGDLYFGRAWHGSRDYAHSMKEHILDTASGRRVDLDNPQPGQVALLDIAGALSRVCRFGAQTLHFYSVAQHAIYVSELVEERDRRDLALAALHHDSHEAYVCDLPSPAKRIIREAGDPNAYDTICSALDRAIYASLGIAAPENGDERLIKEADNVALVVEARALLFEGGAHLIAGMDGLPAWSGSAPQLETPLPPDAATDAFLLRHRCLVA
jgi:hypothetical protein